MEGEAFRPGIGYASYLVLRVGMIARQVIIISEIAQVAILIFNNEH